MLQNFRPVLSESSDKEIGRILSKAREPLATIVAETADSACESLKPSSQSRRRGLRQEDYPHSARD